MTRDEFVGVLAVAELSYRNFDITGNTLAVDMWHSMFMDETLDIFMAAMKLHIQTEKFPPTPATLRECLDELKGESSGMLSAEEAWTQARRLCRYAHSTLELGKRLREIAETQPALRETLRTIPVKEIAYSDVDSMSILRSQFMKSYANSVSRERSRAISAPMLEKLTGGVMPMKAIENPALQYDQRRYQDGELDGLVDEL